MARKVYFTTPKRKRLMDEAMETVRETRATIDPDLLSKVRDAICHAMEREQEQSQRSYTTMHAEKVPVDRRKTLGIVMKYLEMKPGNLRLQDEVRSFLSQS